MAKTTILAVTPGDPEGIGPEVVWKTLQADHSRFKRSKVALLCVGAREPFERLRAPVIEVSAQQLERGLALPPKQRGPYVWLVPAPRASQRFLPGFQSGWSIETATRLVQKGLASALVTGPISKERLQKGGYNYPGHTEFLASLCKTKQVTMMLANDQLRISLVTIHIALKDVPSALTRTELRRAVIQTAQHLREGWGISRPRVAVAALNPHAGESGLFGNEEVRVISPELVSLRKRFGKQFDLYGPLPADTLFAKHHLAQPRGEFDAVVCMYHDQGLIPVKLLDFPNTVNVTLGLPIVRTSVDHGVGFDIAGKGVADPSSFRSAVRMALEITQHSTRSKKRK
jgi:4-hydroxythreonine-4-phosphate dehydrogenase